MGNSSCYILYKFQIKKDKFEKKILNIFLREFSMVNNDFLK